MEEKEFQINVRDEKYSVEVVDFGTEFQYKISTDCNYIMTIHRNEDGNWSANNDVQVLDESLTDEIGNAIEKHDN